VVFFAALVLVVVRSAGWPEVKQSFFSGAEFRNSFPGIASGFLTNVKLFCIAEVIILVFALLIAVLRSIPGPVFFPLRLLAILYADFFRGIPTILLIYILGFGVPGLQLSGVPTSEFFWGTVALVLVYTAYVSEVYRAGIESVHPSQNAAARSLGLTHSQSLRYVVVQDVGRAINPATVEEQIHGGGAQGVGWAMYEEIVHDESGAPITASFMDYTVAKARQIPELEAVLVEVPSPIGPYGAKPVGEPPVIPGGGVIANAVFAAVGARVTELPLTPERVRRAMDLHHAR